MKSNQSRGSSRRNSKATELHSGSSAATHDSSPSVIAPNRDLFPALLALITLAAFLPALRNDFVGADASTIAEHAGFRRLGGSNIKWMFASFHFGQYQPLTWLTFAIDQVFWGTDPFGYHWTNLVLHSVNVLLFYAVARRLLLCSQTRWPDPTRGARMAAGIAALIFAIHPLRVESVAWASARGDLVGAAFFLLSLYGYLRSDASANSGAGSARWNFICVSCFVFSLLASSIGLALPLILLALDIYPLRRLTLWQNRWGTHTRILLRQKTPYFILAGAGAAVLFAARHYQVSQQVSAQESTPAWMLHQLAAPAFYLWKAVMPIGLAPGYELGAWFAAAYAGAGAALCVAIALLKKKWPALAAAWLGFLFLGLPVFRSEFPEHQVLADRFTYLSCCSWALLIGVAFTTGIRYGRRISIYAGMLLVVLLFGMAVLTWTQVGVWRDDETLWRHAVAVNPTSRAYFSLATLYEAQGKYDDAVAAYERAAEINPQQWDAHEKVAVLLQKRGRISRAVEHFQKVIMTNPMAIEARENLAAGLVNQGKIDEAVEQFRKLLELAPERNETRVKLGTILALAGHLDEAADLLTAAVKFDPNDGRNVLKLGQVLAARRRLSEAVNYFREAVRLRPEDAEAHENLGRALLELGKKEEASKHLQKALGILRSTPRAG